MVKNPGNGRLNNLNDPVLNVLTKIYRIEHFSDFFNRSHPVVFYNNKIKTHEIFVICTINLTKCHKYWSHANTNKQPYYELNQFPIRYWLLLQKVAGSIPYGVIGIFCWHNPSGRTMALVLTQPLTEMSTRNISWGGKVGRDLGLKTLPPSHADCLEIWEPQPSGTHSACPGL